MHTSASLRLLLCQAALLCLAPFTHAQASSTPDMTVRVDGTQAARRIQFVHEEIRVHPGQFAISYPKWIPGEHGPTGPIQNVTALDVRAGGKPLAWHRDPLEIFTFLVDVPAGVTTITVDFDVVLQNVISDKQSLLAWNTVLLYPRDTDKTRLLIRPSVLLPDGWAEASAMEETGHHGNEITFAPLNLERLIDSPVLAGRYIRKVKLASEWPAELDISGDSQAELDKADDAHAFDLFAHLLDEDKAMFGFRHWQTFHILMSQSASLPFDGLEHESSPYNGLGAFALGDKHLLEVMGPWLLAHEQSHSWDGKYRRPAELYSRPNYQGPEQTTLLWVYEGLNQYLGMLLAERAGFSSNEFTRHLFAQYAAELAIQPARRVAPLVDTAAENWVIRDAEPAWSSLRRSQDYYTEGALVWLEADVLIRQQSQGKVTLDDFCRRFLGEKDTGPIVNPYTREDVEAALQATWPYDWHSFFEQRIYQPSPAPPTRGIDAAGWHLAYRDTDSATPWYREGSQRGGSVWSGMYSIGLMLRGNGAVVDVLLGSPADKAGLAPDMTIEAVNGNVFSIEAMDDALRHPVAGKVSLIVKNFNTVQTIEIPYTGGVRNPVLERNGDAHDYFADILTARRGNNTTH